MGEAITKQWLKEHQMTGTYNAIEQRRVLREAVEATRKYMALAGADAFTHRDFCNSFNYFEGDGAVCTCGSKEVTEAIQAVDDWFP